MSTAPRHIARPQRSGPQSTPTPRLRVIPGGRQAATPKTARTARKAQAKSRVLFASVVVGVVATLFFGLILLNIIIAQSSFRLNDLNAQVTQEQLRYRRMRFEVAKAESPERIAAAAQSLGLVPPDHQEYLIGRSTFKAPAPPITGQSGQREAMKSILDSGP